MARRVAGLAQHVGQHQLHGLANGQQAQAVLARKQLDQVVLDGGHKALR